MHDLTPLTALGGTQGQIDQIGAVTLSEEPGVALASVAARLGSEKTCATALKKWLGVAAPGPGKMTTKGDLAAFWTGPDQWMIEAPYDSHELLADMLKDTLGAKASVTEQSDAWARFDLTGDGALDVLERLCPVNTRAMQSGDATRSAVEHMGAFVLCRKAGTHFSVIGARSSAGSLHHALLSTMTSALS